MYDYIIKGGTVVDGSGQPPYAADVAVKDGRIVLIGVAQGECPTIEAAGCVVMPGVIDLHTHSDLNLMLDGRAESFLRQAVTTEVIGNCGYSAAPLLGEADLKRNVFCYRGSGTPGWKSFSEYTERLGASLCINVVPLAGHAAVRSSVMGYADRPASREELNAMCQLLNDCFDQGAAGFSTGLEYFPGAAADSQELKALCSVTAARGKLYATHVRNRDKYFESGFFEAVKMADDTGVRLQLSHAVPKYGAPEGSGERVLELIEAASRTTDTAFDVIPYEWGPTAITAMLPKNMLQYGADDIARMLRDSTVRQEIKSRKEYFWQLISDGCWDDISLYFSTRCQQYEGMSMRQIAALRKKLPMDALLDIIEMEGEDMFSAVIMGRIKSGENLKLMMQHKLCGIISDAMSLSGGGPLGGIKWSLACYGWVPELFGRYVAEMKLLTLQEAVRRVTSYPAERVGLKDRGYIRQGKVADIAVIDMEKFVAGKPEGLAEGLRCLMIGGQMAVENDCLTGAAAGRVLRV